jgi:23S rRNA (uracil1939-C5)-methyltransferase
VSRREEFPLQKNERIVLHIDGLDSRGFGVGRCRDVAVFVQGALPGEEVEAHVIKCAKNYAVAKLCAILQESPNRCVPDCPAYPRCGGCSLRHMTYEAQLAYKRQSVQDAFARLGGMPDVQVRPVVGAPSVLRYRNKAQFPVCEGPAIGFYKRHSHAVVDIADCPVQTQNAMQACAALRNYMQQSSVGAYDERRGKGLVRHLMTRCNQAGQLVVTVVANAAHLPQEELLVALMRAQVDGLLGVVLNVNTRRDNVIMGTTCRTLWGTPLLEESLCGKVFSISPMAFFQVNTVQTQTLYALAAEAAQLTGQETLLDLYCGTGTIGITMADQVRELIGIESVEPAVEDARRNAQRNHVSNARFYAARAEELLPQMAEAGQRADVAILDPPRGGCEKPLLDAVCRIAPKRIVYVSCNPATLARDAAILCQNGYRVEYAQPVDLFPMTEHVETVCLMSRVCGDN